MKILNLNFKVIGASFCTLVMLGCSASDKASEMKEQYENKDSNNKDLYCKSNEFLKFCESLKKNLALSEVENLSKKIEEFKLYFSSIEGKKSFSHLYSKPTIYIKEDYADVAKFLNGEKSFAEGEMSSLVENLKIITQICESKLEKELKHKAEEKQERECSLEDLLEAPFNKRIKNIVLGSNSLESLIFIWAALQSTQKSWNIKSNSVELYNEIINDFAREYNLVKTGTTICIELFTSTIRDIIDNIKFTEILEEKQGPIKKNLYEILEIIEIKISKEENLFLGLITENLIKKRCLAVDDLKNSEKCDCVGSSDITLTEGEKIIDYIVTSESRNFNIFVNLIKGYFKEKLNNRTINYLELYKVVASLSGKDIRGSDFRDIVEALYYKESSDELKSICMSIFTYSIKKILERNNMYNEESTKFQNLDKMSNWLFLKGPEECTDKAWRFYALVDEFEIEPEGGSKPLGILGEEGEISQESNEPSLLVKFFSEKEMNDNDFNDFFVDKDKVVSNASCYILENSESTIVKITKPVSTRDFLEKEESEKVNEGKNNEEKEGVNYSDVYYIIDDPKEEAIGNPVYENTNEIIKQDLGTKESPDNHGLAGKDPQKTCTKEFVEFTYSVDKKLKDVEKKELVFLRCDNHKNYAKVLKGVLKKNVCTSLNDKIEEIMFMNHSFIDQYISNIVLDQFKSAERVCIDALEFFPNNPLIICLLAELHRLNNNLEDAEKLYGAAIDRGLEYCCCYSGLGIVLQKNEKSECDHGSNFKKALDLNYKCVYAHYGLAKSYYLDKNYNSAIDHSKKAIESLYSCDCVVYNHTGIGNNIYKNFKNDIYKILIKSHLIGKECEQLGIELEKIIANISNIFYDFYCKDVSEILDEVFKEFSEDLYKKGYEEVLHACDEVIKFEWLTKDVKKIFCQRKFDILFKLGGHYWENQDYIKAMEAYENSLELEVDIKSINLRKCTLAKVYYNYGQILMQDKKWDDAIKFYNKAVTLFLTNGNKQDVYASYDKLGKCFYGKKEYDSALKYCNLALKDNFNENFIKNKTNIIDFLRKNTPQNADECMMYGKSFCILTYYKEATDYFVQALNYDQAQYDTIIDMFSKLEDKFTENKQHYDIQFIVQLKQEKILKYAPKK